MLLVTLSAWSDDVDRYASNSVLSSGTWVKIRISEPGVYQLTTSDLKNMGFRILLVSNQSKRKVTPFKELLCVDSAYFALKPLKFKYKKILKIYNLESHQVACIGSSLLFDVLGANRMDFTSIYVNPISEDINALSKISRKVEDHFSKRLTKKGLFRKGRYYE